MAKEGLNNEGWAYDDFLQLVSPDCWGFTEQTREFLLQNSCKMSIKPAANGCLVSYVYEPSKRVLINFVFRKKGLVTRVYGDRVGKYPEFLQTLPPGMVKSIGKAPACKRLTGTGDCNSRCAMGYDFSIGNTRYQKCRYNCFMFEVNTENSPFILEFVERELQAREAADC